MEIYVRLNDDLERDYAFQIEKDDTFESKLMKLFDRKEGLARYMVLRPSVFYKDVPRGLCKSTHPGFLTEQGCLLFDYNANKEQHLQPLELREKKVWEQMWPGQLVVPQYEKSWATILGFAALMLAWLYTDLPDVVSPTPGICFTNQLSRMFMYLAQTHGYPHVAAKLAEEIQVNSTGLLAQWLFFTLHVVKVALIALFFYSGLINPISLNPVKVYSARQAFTAGSNKELAEVLRSFGWIGAKRATYDDYRDTYYQAAIDKAGGTVAAYKSGILKKASDPGVALSAGEGFQTPLENRFRENTFKTMEERRKFVLSEDYFVQLEKDLKNNIEKCNGDVAKVNAEIRRFRKFGFFDAGEELQRLVQLRKEVVPSRESNEDKKEKKTI
ncbi:AFR381Cp [Eremothecium gossypii ATCC 10895]|uniref:AFR381Cp n=1 Tax=Eremothecium gossypii (strain ATCC 10895 / CBS 109.51 / FGSC 9923 / NRRL Y-1056) TaxID=284811 RepID=Q753D5_EREGS|nr:AFR381Cp [Eremothecium gossypii ATCC 10895]AAS53752.1 AFR381Cp [Eremothecium gossypii ATCC 10895]AEY98064.1 FAFR381Cp [Eremothecium gossypii FDAG1]